MFGVGFYIPDQIAGGFTFSDADAQNVYDTLVVENGGDLDASIYSLSLDALKQGIQDVFTTVKSDGTFTKLNALGLIVGGNAQTHAVDAISAASLFSMVGSPLHGKNGVTLNGSSQYINTNVDSSTFQTINDGSCLFYGNMTTVPATLNAFMGSRNSGSAGFRLWETIADVMEMQFGSGTTLATSAVPYSNKTYIVNVESGVLKIYEDNVEIASFSPTSGAVPTAHWFVGAYDNSGTPLNFTAGDIRSFALGTNLTVSQVATLNSALKTFNTLLGR